jgi:glycosyltransferase involved in cell wall biosynthesis
MNSFSAPAVPAQEASLPGGLKSVLYEVVFVLNINSRGWILHKICKVIAAAIDGPTRIVFTEKNNAPPGWLPAARAYFFGHFKPFIGALKSGSLPADCKKYVWFTHQSFDETNTAEVMVSALRRATLVFTANSFHARALEFLGIPGEQIHTILGGADPDIFKPERRGSSTVGIVGGYYERKNPDLLLATVQAMPDKTFILLGPDPSEVENKGLMWENWVRFPELLACPNFRYIAGRYEDFPEHFARFDVYLSLSDLEGGPIPLIEAMFANCFPVVTRTGFAEDIIDDGRNGLLLPVRPKLDQVTAAIRAGLEDSSTDVAATAADLSWQAFGREFQNCIQPVVLADTPISFGSERTRLEYLGNGWSEIDDAGAWLALRSGDVMLRTEPLAKSLKVTFRAHPAAAADGVPLRITVDGALADDGIFEGGLHRREIPLPAPKPYELIHVCFELTAAFVEDLGTIRLDSLEALSRDAVAPPHAGERIVESIADGTGDTEEPLLQVPVIVAIDPERPQLRKLSRELRTRLGFEVHDADRETVSHSPETITIADDLPASRIASLPHVDAIVARDVDGMKAAAELAEVPRVRIQRPLLQMRVRRVWPLDAPITRAVLFRSANAAYAQSFDWISAALEEEGIPLTFTDVEPALKTLGSSRADTISALAGEDAPVCFFSGAEEELHLIDACLGLGASVLIYGPSVLYPALVQHQLQPIYVHNPPRLQKSFRMLRRANNRRTYVEKLQAFLSAVRGIDAIVQSYAELALGIAAERDLRRIHPRAGILYTGGLGNEDPGYVAAVAACIRELGIDTSLFCMADQVPASLAALDVPITTVENSRSAQTSAMLSSTARAEFAEFAAKEDLDLLLFFSPGASPFLSLSRSAAVKAIQVSGALSEEPDWRLLGFAPAGRIDSPVLMPAKSGFSASDAAANWQAGRDLLSLAPDDILVVAPEGPILPTTELSEAIATATTVRLPIRFVVLQNPQGEASESGRVAGTDISVAEADKVDRVLEAADIALVSSAPLDPTFLWRALASGTPVLMRGDLSGAGLIGSKILGATYDPTNHADFEKKFKQLLKDGAAREAMAMRARAAAAGLPTYDQFRLACASEIARCLLDDNPIARTPGPIEAE